MSPKLHLNPNRVKVNNKLEMFALKQVTGKKKLKSNF